MTPSTSTCNGIWKSRIVKARKALGALSGVGGTSQWGMCPGWNQAYKNHRDVGGGVGMERTEGLRKGFGRIQYQALRKATGATQGTSGDLVNKLTGVEDDRTHLDNCQARFFFFFFLKKNHYSRAG